MYITINENSELHLCIYCIKRASRRICLHFVVGIYFLQEAKDFNRNINSARAATENINQRLKSYTILGDVHKGSVHDSHKITKIIHVIADLCNLNLNKHPIRR